MGVDTPNIPLLRRREEMVIDQWSIVLCHFRMRLRRGIQEKTARSASTDDKRQLTINQ